MSVMDESTEPEDTDSIDLLEEVKDMFVNAEAWVGGQPGVGTPRAFEYARSQGLLGPKGCLTQRGMARAQREQRTAFYGGRWP